MLELLFTVLFAIFLAVLSFGISGAFVIPFVGIVVRLRANYAPRGLALYDLEAEGGDPRTGPAVRKLWGMFQRVRRLEGWRGLYKGAVPYTLFSMLIAVASIVFIGSQSTLTPKGTYSMPDAGGLRMTLWSIALTLIGLPMTIIVNRAIVTPHLLPWHPVEALQILLTPYERSRPWVMFKAPGLLAATTLAVLWSTVVATFVRSVLVAELANGILKDPASSRDGPFARVRPGRLLAFLAFQAASTLVLAPLETVAVRLSVQRQNAPGEVSTGEVPVEYAAKEEDVVGLRSEEEPYTGLVDAVRTIYTEEGPGALYTAWIVTMAGALLGTFQ